jgi:hypothetical protein
LNKNPKIWVSLARKMMMHKTNKKTM